MIKSSFKLITVGLAAVLLSACSTMTMGEHDEKYNDMSIDKLLDAENLSGDKRDLFERSLIKRAGIKSQKGDHASAARHARMALKLSPDDPEIRLKLAEALLEGGEYAEAGTEFEKVATENPSAVASQGVGLSLLARGNTDEAQTWLNKAVAEDANLWRSWNGLGIIYDMSETWTLAEQSYKAGIAVAGQNATINNNLGISYLKQNRLQEAIIAFENVQALPGGKALSDMNYRTALALNGDMEKAINGATDVNVAKLYNNLGVLAMRDGNPEQAVVYLKKAIETNPAYYANAVKNLEIAKSALP